MINYEEFSKIELRTAKIISAERVEGSEKLIRLQVELGPEQRQILAGIGKTYEPESLVGKTVIIVANLEPRKLMGQISQGMLLAADDGGGPVILTIEKEINSGAQVK